MTNQEKLDALLSIVEGVILNTDDSVGTTTAGIKAANDWFTAAPIRIPDPTGTDYFRSAVDIFRSSEFTVKLHYWHFADEREQPHNHPWKDSNGISFTSRILVGGYRENVYWVDATGEVQYETREYSVGDKNVSLYKEYHAVTEVIPGTVTLMVCGNQVPDNEWGYLDVQTGRYTKAEKSDDFTGRFMATNTHLQQK